jgi:hypothetical protein
MLHFASAVLALILAGGFGWLAFYAIRLRRQAVQYKKKFESVVRKDPTELELELATTEQLLNELRQRHQLQFLLMLPQFEPAGIALQMEIHNIPPAIALDLLKLAYQMTAKKQGRDPDVDSPIFPIEDESDES